MVKHIPNSLTIGNLLSGCLGIILVFDDQMMWASVCVGIALLFDFGDGLVARLLKVSSPMGKELDSLADMVTFGVLPTLMLYQFMQSSCLTGRCTGMVPPDYFPFMSFIFAACAALRLARFNITPESNTFTGVPTPAAAMVVASFPLILLEGGFLIELLHSPKTYGIIALFLSALMVSNLPMLSLKFSHLRLKNNLFRYLLAFGSVCCIGFLQFSAVPIIFLLYVGLSILQTITKSKK